MHLRANQSVLSNFGGCKKEHIGGLSKVSIDGTVERLFLPGAIVNSDTYPKKGQLENDGS